MPTLISADSHAHSPRPPGKSLQQLLRSEVVGGGLLIAATVLALILANTGFGPWYETLRDTRIGPEAFSLNLSLRSWAADGLLAIFFFVVGLELKEEFVAGHLRDPKQAALPITAAIGGVVVPALVYLLILQLRGGDAFQGWAIPTATDIAFALAVLAVVGRHLPPALRVFLLTLAIVDDLIAITIIATFYTASTELIWLGLALIPLTLFGVLVQRGQRAWWLLLPLAFATWALVHASGIHATVAGVLLGFTVPVKTTPRARVQTGVSSKGEPVYRGLAAHFVYRWGVVTSLIAVPLFAFFSAGVNVGGAEGLRTALTAPVTLAIMAGLVLGKPLGIVLTTFLLTRFRAFSLDPSLRLSDVLGLALLAGIGFTVSLLIGELAFSEAPEQGTYVTIGVLVGSTIAALAGAGMLWARNRARVTNASSGHDRHSA